MFQIRSEQVQAYSAALVDQANQKLIKYAQQRFPSEFENSDDSSMLEFVRSVRIAAAQYGIEKENDVGTFLDFTVMYGVDFPQAPWAEDVLSIDDMHGPDKMVLLRFRVSETDVQL